MDKLHQISREGGFPLCAETLQVLYDNARAVNVLLAGLDLPDNSAVILGSEIESHGHSAYNYLYAVSSGNRRLVRYTMGSGVDLNNAKVNITETHYNVTGSNNTTTIGNVYTLERATIVSTSLNERGWNFYRLEDVLEPAIYNDLLPNLRTQLANTDITLGEDYGNILCKNAKKLRVKLKLAANIPSGSNQVLNTPSYTLTVPMPITIQGAHSLNTVLNFNDNNYTMRALLDGSGLKVYAGEILDVLAPSGTTWYSQGWTMYINSEILL